MGALAFHTGGLLVDHGWLRILGGGCDEFPRALDRWNHVGATPRCHHGLLIADDLVGGFFAWFREPRTIHYLAPDTLEWEDLGFGYTDWLRWTFTEAFRTFASDFRWDGWEKEVPRADQALGIYPPLFTEKSHISKRARRAVPIDEVWLLINQFADQLRTE